MTRLPDKLSDLLELAVNDAEAIEKTPGYVLRMGTWHYFERDTNTCMVCMAGAVMARSLGVERDRSVDLWAYDKDTTEKLARIDDLRTGITRNYVGLAALTKVFVESRNNSSRRASWATYRAAVAKLREAGL